MAHSRLVNIWQAIQQVYMPCVAGLRSATAAPAGHGEEMNDSMLPESISACDVSLHLPDSLPSNLRSQLPSKLIAKYRKLRLAQAEDAMASMKKHLRKGATLFKHKKDHIAGTGVAANTRMQNAISRQDAKTRLDAAKYSSARKALLVLCPSGKWKKRLRVLRDADIRPPTSDGGPGEGRRKLTWIWRMIPASDDELQPLDGADEEDDNVEDGDDSDGENHGEGGSLTAEELEDLRVEWARSLARAERWEEELRLLKTEMVRSLRFLDFKSKEWIALISKRASLLPDIRAGLSGYAHKQACMFRRIARKFAAQWIQLFRVNERKLPHTWPLAYRTVVLASTQVKRRPERQNAYKRLREDAASNGEDSENEMEVDV
ncbi:hypothetical protein SCHPADRAFT_947640 [Schizopora paradoxa]|uniref:Uncharacterized protein n=1 Tax=Schizopora paradoxa TaxID=27342 RepID=A0A0H2QY77_9AGAM|nr:hypothetical protein SCHPADRAFT_947640 [Schizopora paradoxa]